MPKDFQLFQLLGVNIKFPPLKEELMKGIFGYLSMRIPEEVADRVLLVESLATDASPANITFGLMLLDTETFDVEPFSALVLALDHD